MEKDATEKNASEEKDTIEIATIEAVAKAIKDNAGQRKFRYNGKNDDKKAHGKNGLGCSLLMCCRCTSPV